MLLDVLEIGLIGQVGSRETEMEDPGRRSNREEVHVVGGGTINLYTPCTGGVPDT